MGRIKALYLFRRRTYKVPGKHLCERAPKVGHLKGGLLTVRGWTTTRPNLSTPTANKAAG
jgi:hypothetical protein